MILFLIVGNDAPTIGTPSGGGWTTLLPVQKMSSGSSRSVVVFGKVKDASDTSTTYTVSASAGGRASLSWGAGSDVIANWITGTPGMRGSIGTPTTTVGPSLTTTQDDALVISLHSEASSGTPETGISGIDGATEWFFGAPDGNAAETSEVAYLDMPSAGASGDITVTWPNAHASNGWAVNIGIQSAEPVPAVTHVGTYRQTSSILGVGVKVVNSEAVRIEAQPTAGGTVTVSDAVAPSALGWAYMEASGLAANTAHTVRVYDDASDALLDTVTAGTLAVQKADFTALTGSCQRSNGDPGIYDDMAEAGAAFFVHQGDLHYEDAETEQDWVDGVDAALSNEHMSAFLRSTPMSYIWDNHDWGGNETWRESAPSTWAPDDIRELMGQGYPDSVGLYHTWSHGGVRFIQTDQWTLRDEAMALDSVTDGAIFSDDFDRTGSGGWGMSLDGHVWTNRQGNSVLSTDGTHAVMAFGEGTTNYMFIPDISGTTFETTVITSIPALPASGNAYMIVNGRDIQGVGRYTGYLLVDSSGNMVVRTTRDSTQVSGAEYSGTYVPGDRYNLKFRVAGASPTTLQLKVWKVGTSEPGSWTLDGTDSTSGYQVAGFPGLGGAVSGSNPSGMSVKFEDYALSGTAQVGTDWKVGKSMLGDEQRTWFLDTLASATEPLIVWFSSFPLYGDYLGNGRWGNYRREAAIIGDWLEARPEVKAKIVAIGGDSHNVRADDGTNTMWGIPSLNASPLDRDGDQDGEPEGDWNIVNHRASAGTSPTVTKGYYSLLDFAWDGETLGFTWTAMQEGGTQIATWSADYTSAGSFLKIGGQAVDAVYIGSSAASRIYVGSQQVWP